ncbi:MAG: hypothetical protein PHW73_09740 [Atribacterota bacterium]|nr:hypothetical protein [Atribacterota bacterium]
MEVILSISTFLLGCLVGWFTNHWYSINLKEPQLSQNGGGGGSSMFSTKFHYSHITIRNELRMLAIKLPETVLLGKRLKTRFGDQIVERNPAKECRAQLLDESGKHICHLYWLKNNKILDTVDIESGKSANLLLFVRKEEDSSKFYVYQPTSQSNLAPKVAKVPNFSQSSNFLVRISYSYNKSISFPVGVEIDYNENFYTKTKNGSSLF